MGSLTDVLSVQDPKLLAALQENRKRQAPYAGAFLLKDEPGTDPSLVSGSESEKNIYDLKGKELFNRLHEVGTLAQVSYLSWLWTDLKCIKLSLTDVVCPLKLCIHQISSIQGDQVILIGHRRLRITEMVGRSDQ